MKPRRWTAVLRGLASLIAAAVLLIGVPVTLVAFVGWPLPTKVPDGDTITRAVNTGLTDEFIVNTLAVVVWLCWAQLAFAFIAEAVAAFKGRQPRDLPIASSLQVAAARLVAGIIMLAGPLQPARAMAAEPATPDPVVLVAEQAAPVIDLRTNTANGHTVNGLLPVSEAVLARVGAATRTIAVERHDTYWEIAERELNDGLRWREIQALNVGHTMADGHVLTAADETLRAGWTLDIPDEDPATAPVPTATEIVVSRGDNLWDLSEDRLAVDLEREPTDPEVVPYWTDVIDANHDRLVDPNNPSLIHAGQVLVLPPTGHEHPPPPDAEDPAHQDEPPADAEPEAEVEPEAEAEIPPPPPTTAPPTTSTTAPETTTAVPATTTPTTSIIDSEPSEQTVDAASQDDDEASGSGLGWWLAFGGLSSAALAVGAKRHIERRRREFILDHDGAELPPPDPEQRQLHQTVVGMADEELIGELQYALGELAVDFADSGVPCRPRLVRHSANSLEVLLDQPAAVIPAGWRAEGDGLVLTLDHTINLDLDLEGPSSPAPLMVTVGQPDDDAYIYLDIENEGVVSLVGDVEAARKLARSILTELALTPLAAFNRVITIGDLVDPDAAGLPHLTHKQTWHDFADDFTAWVNQSHHALTLNNWPNAFVGRGHDPDHEALMPMVIIATKPPPPELLDLLIDNQPSAVAIVVADAFEGALTVISCDAEEIYLDDLHVSFTPQQVDITALEDMGRLFNIADLDDDPNDDLDPDHDEELVDDHREGLDLDEPESDDTDEAAEAIDVPTEQCPVADAEADPGADDEPADPPEEAEPPSPPEYKILVRLLGDIRVEGAEKRMHGKATSVTAYLAMNRTLTSEMLEEACWYGAPGASHRKRLLETMTICRDALGSHHLPKNDGGTYTISDAVRTDVELFDWHVAQVPSQEPAEAIESYRCALDLVTGRPFSYPRKDRGTFGWVDFEHQASTWDARVGGVAQAFAELCLDHDKPDVAETTLRRLLQASPLNDGAVAALMRVHIATGDRSAAEHLYQEHVSALDQADLGEPDDTVQQLRLDLDGRDQT